MGSPPALCKKCGLRFPALGIVMDNATNNTFIDCGTNCPRCGGDAKIIDGTYDFVDGVLTAFRAPGVSRDHVIELRNIAESVKDGRTSQSEANSQIGKLGNSLVDVWTMLNGNSGAISVLVAVISLWLAINSYEHGNEKSEKILERQTEIVEVIALELKRMNISIANQQLLDAKNNSIMQKDSPGERAVGNALNRHERRKAHARKRKQHRT